ARVGQRPEGEPVELVHGVGPEAVVPVHLGAAVDHGGVVGDGGELHRAHPRWVRAPLLGRWPRCWAGRPRCWARRTRAAGQPVRRGVATTAVAAGWATGAEVVLDAAGAAVVSGLVDVVVDTGAATFGHTAGSTSAAGRSIEAAAAA